jgi:hypothetical protein
MEREKWMNRGALLWGVLALAAQLWIVITCGGWLHESWRDFSSHFVSFTESMNRFSQLKTPALKYPWAGVYLVLAAAGIIALVAWLWYDGVRDAIARKPADPDER